MAKDHPVSDEDDEEEEGEIEDLPQVREKVKTKGARSSVSAEAYGMWNKKSEYIPKNVPKNAEQQERIKKRLSQAFMFTALDEKEQKIVVNAMEEVKFKYNYKILYLC